VDSDREMENGLGGQGVDCASVGPQRHLLRVWGKPQVLALQMSVGEQAAVGSTHGRDTLRGLGVYLWVQMGEGGRG
jgi:hypothetical protein